MNTEQTDVQQVAFLHKMAANFEAQGNVPEYVKALETAVLLRKSIEANLGPGAGTFVKSLAQQAEEVVVVCNKLGVQHFQEDHYSTASFLLEKAMFLTEPTEETNCFAAAPHDRMRLRAATFNNIGCMEKRRGQYDAAYTFLQKAVELESLIDPDIGATPATSMNLCAVLNKLGRHEQAADEARHAVDTITMQRQQRRAGDTPHPLAQMLVVAYHNLGTSLEYCGRPGDIAKARQAYSAAVQFGSSELPPNNTATHAAAKALERVTQSSGTPTVLPSLMTGPLVSQGSQRSSAAKQSPRPPPGGSRPSLSRGASMSRQGAGVQHQRMDDAISKHAERMNYRKKRKEMQLKQGEKTAQKAVRAHIREMALREMREKEVEDNKREEIAKVMLEKMLAGIRNEEIKKFKSAAKRIQRVWRGYLVRDYVADMEHAAVKIQAAYRSHLCREQIREERENARRAAQASALLNRQTAAAKVLQARARTFLRRVAIHRRYRAAVMRRNACAKRIQQVFRKFQAMKEVAIMNRAERERQEHEERRVKFHRAAMKIQRMFRTFKHRKLARVVMQHTRMRNKSATTIQARVRGMVTRAWYRQYKVLQRLRELSQQRYQGAISRIQRAIRCALARRRLATLRRNKIYDEKTKKLFVVARRIQCCFRMWYARKRCNALRNEKRRCEDAASRIQGFAKMCHDRKCFLALKGEKLRDSSARRLQAWWRVKRVEKSQKEITRYHEERRRREKLALRRTAAAMKIQSLVRGIAGRAVAAQRREFKAGMAAYVVKIQHAGRHYAAQREMLLLKKAAFIVDRNAALAAKRDRAARVIQQETRRFLAAVAMERKAQERAAAISIQAQYRTHLAIEEKNRRRKARQEELEDKSARRIQKTARLFVRRSKLRRLEEYYNQRRYEQLLARRREEAAITVQAMWRGYACRKAVRAEKARLLQNTIDALRIQRAFRSYMFRKSINLVIMGRYMEKRRRASAALRLQCFWRRILAEEFVALLREKKFNGTVAAMSIQCAWRASSARAERANRRETRSRHRHEMVQRHNRWVDASDRVNAFVRTAATQRATLARKEAFLQRQVDEHKALLLALQVHSATKIQAQYRGYAERVYARGLRREYMAEKAKRDALLVKQTAAVHVMQRAVRCYFARRRAEKLRVAARLRIHEEKIQRELAQDPSDIVKGLFWSHEAVTRRNITQEREARDRRRAKAASKIQGCARRFLSLLRHRRARRNTITLRASILIQQFWARHVAKFRSKRLDKRTAASIKIQALMRGALLRSRWPKLSAALNSRRTKAVSQEEHHDSAATVIQSMWRVVCAKRTASNKIRVKAEAKETRALFEAARVLQCFWRLVTARRKVRRIRTEVARQKRSELEGAPYPPTRQPSKPTMARGASGRTFQR